MEAVGKSQRHFSKVLYNRELQYYSTVMDHNEFLAVRSRHQCTLSFWLHDLVQGPFRWRRWVKVNRDGGERKEEIETVIFGVTWALLGSLELKVRGANE